MFFRSGGVSARAPDRIKCGVLFSVKIIINLTIKNMDERSNNLNNINKQKIKM